MSFLSSSEHHIDMLVLDMDNNQIWRVTGIYGWLEDQKNDNTWSLLHQFKQQCALPWLCFGDFNEILCVDEKSGGDIRRFVTMDACRQALNNCDLYDLGRGGGRFTWSNGRKGSANILERLDRFVAFETWRALFPIFSVTHHPIILSDYAPITLFFQATGSTSKPKKKLFRFEQMWLRSQGCEETIKLTRRHESVRGQDIKHKLELCGQALTDWTKYAFGHVNRLLKRKELELGQLQKGQQKMRTFAGRIELRKKLENY